MTSKSSHLGTMIKAALAVGGLALIMAIPASAEIRVNTTGGTSCKGSSGFGAQLFYFSNQTAENTSESGQYLTCNIPTMHSGAPTPNRIEAILYNPSDVATEATCALQSGYELGASSTLVTTAIYTIPIAAASVAVLDSSASTTPAIPGGSGYYPYTLTCLVPAGNKLGVIAVRLPGSFTPDA